jgi:hypothetical protein
MSNRTQRLCTWLSVHVCLWRTPRTAVATVARGQRPWQRRCFVLVILGLSGGVLQWYLGREEARPVQLGLMLPEQALAHAVATSPPPTATPAAVTTATVDTASATHTVLSAPVAPLVVPTTLITDSAVPTEPLHACVSPPLVPVVIDVNVNATAPRQQRSVVSDGTQRQQTTSRQHQRRRLARLAPPRGLTIVAVASRSALLRLPQGSLVTVQAGARLQGWTVQRFSPAGMTLTHHDQRTVLSMTAELRQRR